MIISGVVLWISNDVDVDEVSDDIVIGVDEVEESEWRTGTSISGTVPAPKSWISDDSDFISSVILCCNACNSSATSDIWCDAIVISSWLTD